MLPQKFIRTCFKAQFITKPYARKQLKLINMQMKGVPHWKPLTDVYWCEECQSWHHTSMNKSDSREFNRKKEKLKENGKDIPRNSV